MTCTWRLTIPRWRQPGSPAPLPPVEWDEQGLCVTEPGNWFPDPSQAAHSTAEKAVCGRCPVREACLAYALDARELWGIWGGLDPEERLALVRRLTTTVTTGTEHGPSRAA